MRLSRWLRRGSRCQRIQSHTEPAGNQEDIQSSGCVRHSTPPSWWTGLPLSSCLMWPYVCGAVRSRPGYSSANIALPLAFLVISEEGCWSDNPLQIFVRDRTDQGDPQFIGDKPVRLL